MKKVLKIIGIILLVIVVLLGGFVAYLSIKEYKPDDVESIQVQNTKDNTSFSGETVSVLSFNTGYSGLGDNADFFMDGGQEVKSTDEVRMKENMAEIASLITETGADFTLLQEVDQNSSRTYHVDQTQEYMTQTGFSGAYALNYSCPFVPYPLPPIGQVNSGILTLTNYSVSTAERISLPCPFSWPVSTANLKRCLLVTRIPIEGSDRELVIVNLHLEAYDDGEGKAAQTEMLFSVLQQEYEKGNYVIAGGDFNQTFPGGLDAYPTLDSSTWVPGVLESSILPEGWHFAYDTGAPSCRLLNQPYDPSDPATQYYVIDGYILSPNVEAIRVQTMDLQFHASDHNPVYLEAKLK
ncbi:MAG: endonuclease/exonuclease/phosphatase family protein [Clostridia bacterium]